MKSNYPLGKCQCGCGGDTNLNPKKKQPYDFLRGHGTRAKTLPDGRRVCKYCGEAKPLEDFVKREWNHADGRDNRCKNCYAAKQREYYNRNREQYSRASKNRSLKRKYGIDLGQFEQLLEDQNHQCAICDQQLEISWDGKWKNGNSRNSRLDHCHKNGVVRGILCHNCNAGLGMFDDSSMRLSRAIKYLQKESTV